MPNRIVLAVEVTTQIPQWLNGPFIFGVLLAIATLLCVIGAVRMLNGADKQKTGAVAGGLLNYIIILAFIVLVIGGSVIAIAQGIGTEVFNTGMAGL